MQINALRLQHIMLLYLILLAIGCTSPVPFDDAYTRISENTLADSSQQPTGDVLLTVSGRIGNTNVDNTYQMDREMLERVGFVEYTITDPFEETEKRFTGVLMRDLFELWQVPADVETIKMTAINDYVVEVPVADFFEYPVILALQEDGINMEPSYRGPMMLVYPSHAYDFDISVYNAYWIWQLKTIDIP